MDRKLLHYIDEQITNVLMPEFDLSREDIENYLIESAQNYKQRGCRP